MNHRMQPNQLNKNDAPPMFTRQIINGADLTLMFIQGDGIPYQVKFSKVADESLLEATNYQSQDYDSALREYQRLYKANFQ